jgi:hypothetical protein
MSSVFQDYMNKSYPFQFNGALNISVVVGGVPSDPKVAEGWLKTKIQDTDANIQEAIAKTMLERGVDADEATRVVNELRNLNGFKRGLPEDVGHEGELYIEGRQLKAALKEAVSVAAAAKKIDLSGWGATRKFLTNYLPEHVFVAEDKLWLGVKQESGVMQQFVHTFRGSSIQYQEYVRNATIEFTVLADHDFTPDQWALIWTTGQFQGLGASRSQGHGKYAVTKWEPVDGKVVQLENGDTVYEWVNLPKYAQSTATPRVRTKAAAK